jgi:hypothetical protein
MFLGLIGLKYNFIHNISFMLEIFFRAIETGSTDKKFSGHVRSLSSVFPNFIVHLEFHSTLDINDTFSSKVEFLESSCAMAVSGVIAP